MSAYKRMVGLLAREPERELKAKLKGNPAAIVAHLKAGADDPPEAGLNPESEAALDATQAEGAQMVAALVTWAGLSLDERGQVAQLLKQAGWEDARFDLMHDFDMRLPS